MTGLSKKWLIAIVGFAVLVIQLAFISSYVGALHSPEPHGLGVGVLASNSQIRSLSASIGPSSSDFSLLPVASKAKLVQEVEDAQLFAGYIPSQHSSTLYVSSAQGTVATSLIEGVFSQVALQSHSALHTADLEPLPRNNSGGLVQFYLVIGWIVGAYLFAVIFGLLVGMTPNGLVGYFRRLPMFLLYSILSGIGGATIVTNAFGYQQGHELSIVLIGTLIVGSVSLTTAALQSAGGLVGTGLVILGFVVVGNPSAGGPWPMAMLPAPWRQIGGWLPNGAGLNAVRDVLFFHGHDLGSQILVLGIYAAVGLGLLALLSVRGRPLVEISLASRD